MHTFSLFSQHFRTLIRKLYFPMFSNVKWALYYVYRASGERLVNLICSEFFFFFFCSRFSCSNSFANDQVDMLLLLLIFVWYRHSFIETLMLWWYITKRPGMIVVVLKSGNKLAQETARLFKENRQIWTRSVLGITII